MSAVLIALGDEFRRDDGVGPAVARSLHRDGVPARTVISPGDPIELIEAWSGARVAVVLDALRMPHPRPGRVHVLAAADLPVAPSGSHGFDLGAAIALGGALGRTPARLVIVAVEVADVAPGRGLSPAVAAAVPAVARAVAAALSADAEPRRDHPGPVAGVTDR
ncbi:hydrogenase maturation protease [Rhodococcus sp. NPDC003322]